MKMDILILASVIYLLFLLPYVLYAHLGREKSPGWMVGMAVLLLGGLPQLIFCIGVAHAVHKGYMWALPVSAVALACWPLVVRLCRRSALWPRLELCMWGLAGMTGLWMLALLVVYALQ